VLLFTDPLQITTILHACYPVIVVIRFYLYVSQVRPVRDSMIDAVQVWKKLTGEDVNGINMLFCLTSFSVLYYYFEFNVYITICNTMQQTVKIRRQLMVMGKWTQKDQCKTVEK
jgi:hypothetical protein